MKIVVEVKKVIALFVLILSVLGSAYSQQQYFFYLDRFYSPVKGNEKPYYLRIAFQHGDNWAYNDVDAKQNLIQAGFFTDTFFTKPVGHYVRYTGNSMKFYEGNFSNGIPSGTWYFYKNGTISDSLHYYEAMPVSSTVPKALTTSYDKVPAPDSAVKLVVEEKVFNRVEVEASFEGGDKGWNKYLTRIYERDMPDMVSEELRMGKYTTTVQFIVCTDGQVCDVEALSSTHPLFDLMAINAIRKGPKWTPASQDNRKVKAYRRQNITLVVPD